MLCRLCLYECDVEAAFELFLQNGDETNVTKLIAKYVRVEITSNDAFSTIICEKCNKHLDEFNKFLEMVEERQNQLVRKEFLEVKCDEHIQNVDAAGYQNEESLLDIKDVLAECEAVLEFSQALDAERDDTTSDFIDENDGTNMPDDKDDDDDDDDLPLNALITKKAPRKLTRAVKNKKNVKKQKSISLGLKRKTRKKPIEKIKQAPSTNNENDETYKEKNQKRDEWITTHMKMKCELCEDELKTFKDLKIHFRQEHKSRAFIVCCSQRFYKRFQLVDHINVHLNPDHFKCKLCGKVLSSRTCMEVHNANTHADKSNLKHGCPKCERRFAHMSNLQAHLLSHTEERKFSCDECSKAFKSAYMLKVHKQKMHETRQYFICDTCGKEYRFKPSFLRHVAEHETGATAPTEECPICGKLLMPNGLRRHLDRHNVEDIECHICGKKLKSKAALKGHIDYAHKKQRSYNCTFCDKSFKRPCVLKEHIAMHTGQKLYNCPNCTREFRSKANMYAHNKKVHRAEWELAQAQLKAAEGGGVQKSTADIADTGNEMEFAANVACG